ncbi:MAG: hypothetical protein ABR519_07985 [Bacteroidales bacterium]
MMKLPLKYILLLIPAIILSCGKIKQIPPEPSIEFRQVEVFDTIEPQLGNMARASRITFYFEDGDGDIGYIRDYAGDNDTLNLFFEAWLKKNGLFTEPDNDDLIQSTSFSIPDIEPEGQNKIVRGTIDVVLFYYLFNVDDTARYEFYLKDRAGNISNVSETCEIPIGYPGIYPDDK